MGKSRQKKANANRADPMAIKAVKAPTDPELIQLREQHVLPIIKDLRSSDLKARGAAASAIANIVQQEKCRKLLLREQIVPIVLTETLTDSSLDSRAAGWEILRVIATEEDKDFCVHLFRLEILTAIEHAVKTVVRTVQDASFPKSPRPQQQLIWNIATAVISLLSGLAAARDEIMEAIVANTQIVPFICFLVTFKSTPYDVLIENLSCLMTLSEDSLKASQLILGDSSNCFRHLTKLSTLDGPTGVHACGVLHTIYSALGWHDGSPGLDGATDAKIIPSLAAFLRKSRQDQKTYVVAGADTVAVTLALEILASIATDLQDSMTKGKQIQEKWNGIDDAAAEANDAIEDEDMEIANDEEEEEAVGGIEAEGVEEEDEDMEMEMDDDAIDADMDLVTGLDDDAEDDTALEEVPTLRAFLQLAIPQLLRLGNYAPHTPEAISIQAEAISALNNIAWTLSCFDYSEPGTASILRAWTPIATRIWTKIIAPTLVLDTADVNLASLITSMAWAVSRTLQGSTPVISEEPTKFMSLYAASKGLSPEVAEEAAKGADLDPFQGLGVKCIGVLGQLAQDPCPIKTNRQVGVFLITVLNALPDSRPADVVEALNQLMEIYSDESLPCDREVFWKDDFLKHLEEVHPKVKTMVKSIDKRGATSELRVRADQALMNLGRFIQYKKKNAPEMAS
ncbi:hypothetical protein N0V93_007425 [Gnomoniopsis smithogilvyi]|uniref:SYO1-like TPR repeats domain-containing protein n=1 Tax=Gnomoniopsis smithogilvyi TaxID=1191159 RepID=A0A9W8YQ17_9PEZI|nr:hypothetical protein N0V93_007425 [Gnomoniopsis smithogilvyi]